MENGNLSESLKTIVSYNFVSIMFIFIILLIYGFGKDYLLFEIYNVAVSFESMGMVGSWVASFIATSSNYLDIIPQYLDLFWLLLTITLFSELIIASYYAKREGWFSNLGFLTVGILFMLFMTSLLTTVVDWVQVNLIDSVLGNISYSIPFITFYLNNALIINTVLIVICLIVNYIDLDFSGFENRKERENMKEVV